MGDRVHIVIAAFDNDEYPGWINKYVNIESRVAGMVKELGEDYAKFRRELHDWAGDNDELGVFNQTFMKSEDWGVSSSAVPSVLARSTRRTPRTRRTASSTRPRWLRLRTSSRNWIFLFLAWYFLKISWRKLF